MNPSPDELVSQQIDVAFDLAARNLPASAAAAFALARSLATTSQPAGAVQKKVSSHLSALVRERQQYRSIIARQRKSKSSVVVIADSLGMPRPDDKAGPYNGADRTYPFMLLDELPDRAVQSLCQRYLTTREVLDLLHDEPALGQGSDVVLHVGLNDCANRMFLEPDRLALDLLSPETKQKVVTFAQRHRRTILQHLPEYHYVDPDAFEANLDAILLLLRRRGARRVVVATIILPPVKFWPATPWLQRNFGRYNLRLMDAAYRHGAVLLDIDRHIWDRQHDGVLLDDGMHLSEAGHRIFARETAALLR